MASYETDPAFNANEYTPYTDEYKIAEYQYRADVADFCALIYQKLLGLGAMCANGYGWAAFDCQNNPQEGSIMDISRRDIIVLVDRTAKGRPFIRIIENELIGEGEGAEYYCTHFTLNDDGDCQYFVDSARKDFEDPTSPVPMRPDLKTPQSLFAAVYLIDDQNNVHVTDVVKCMNAPRISLQVGGLNQNKAVMPFGHVGFLGDKKHALNVGSEMFSMVQNIQPTIICIASDLNEQE